jgi:hypothetical protein
MFISRKHGKIEHTFFPVIVARSGFRLTECSRQENNSAYTYKSQDQTNITPAGWGLHATPSIVDVSSQYPNSLIVIKHKMCDNI